MNTEILKYINADTAAGLTGVLCTIIEAQGSSPREAGTSMWVTADVVRGTVGGGVSEHEVIKKAREMLKTGDVTCIIKKNLTAEEGLACGGAIQVYLEKIGNDPELSSAEDMSDGLLQKSLLLSVSALPFGTTVPTVLLKTYSLKRGVCAARWSSSF